MFADHERKNIEKIKRVFFTCKQTTLLWFSIVFYEWIISEFLNETLHTHSKGNWPLHRVDWLMVCY